MVAEEGGLRKKGGEVGGGRRGKGRGRGGIKEGGLRMRED